MAWESEVPENKQVGESRPLFELKFNDYRVGGQPYHQLRVNSPALTDAVWSEHFRPVEDRLEEMSDGRLDLDLRACVWGDPIPLLCLVILVRRLRQRRVNVQIILSLPGESASERVHRWAGAESNPRLFTNGGRFLAFLANEGFIDELLRFSALIELKGKNRKVTVKTSSDVLRELSKQEPLAYPESTALQVGTISIDRPFDEGVRKAITDEISKRLNGPLFQARIQSEVETRFSEELLSRLRVILIEGLINIAEHAYDDQDESKVGAYYARFRKGLIGANQSDRLQLQAFLGEESKESQRLDGTFLHHQKGCLEVFVADSGVGLVKKLVETHPELTDHPHKFRYYIENVLSRGMSSNPERRTAKGALSLIHDNASRYGDYLRIYSDQFWLGSSAPIPKRANISKLVTHRKVATGPRGLYWHFRLGWQAANDIDGAWISIAKFPAAMKAAQESYARAITDAARSGFAKALVLRGSEEFSSDPESDAPRHLERHPDTSVVVWYSGRRLLKNDILKRVMEIADLEPKRVYRKLYIVDIETHDADFYLGALRALRTDLRYEWPHAFKEIVLVTSTWKVCALEYQREPTEDDPDVGRHGFVERRAMGTKFYDVGDTEQPSLSDARVCNLVSFFRWHASQLFWKALAAEDQLNAVYFNGPVEWSENPRLVINGYLDFGLASTIASCKRILAGELRRYCLLHADSVPTLYSFDSYVANIVDYVDWMLGPSTQGKQRHRHGIGSVLVTGKTLEAHDAEDGKHIHFFAHPNAVRAFGAARTLLYWPSGDGWFERRIPRSGVEPRRRIGSTAAISAKGNKTFSLPRWSDDGKSVAVRDPQLTYDDIQNSPPLVQSGHWSDGSHHDFLSLNVRNAVSRSDIDGHGVFTYIATCIISALRLSLELTEHGRTRYASFRAEHGNSRKEFKTQACAVAYPMRGDGAHMVELFLERYVAPDFRGVVVNRLIGIGDIRSTGSRLPILMSPSASEKIKAALEAKVPGAGTLMFIDDAGITGKTHTELNSVLRALGAKRVLTVLGVDRRRLPSGRVTSEDLSAYWRLDIPPLGDAYTCPICAARSDLGLLTSLLSSEQLVEHTNSVLARWEAMDPNRNWDKALRPIPLNSVSLKYGLVEGSVRGQRPHVEVRSSTALATWYVELETMTGSEQTYERAIEKLQGRAIAGEQGETLAKLELMASALLYFSGSLAPKRLLSIVDEMFAIIIKIRTNGEHTALASLAIISAVNTVLQYGGARFEAIVDRHLGNDIEALSDDARMLITVLIAKKAIAVTHPRVLQISRLLFGMPVPLAHRYNLFHAELLSPIGNLHGRPLMKISEGVDFSSYGSSAVMREALASCDFLLKFIQTIPFDFAADTAPTSKSDGINILEKVHGALTVARDDLRQASKEKGTLNDVKASCVDLVEQLKELRDRLAINIKSLLPAIRNLVNEAIEEWPSNMVRPETDIGRSAKKSKLALRDEEERWLVWDNQIRLALKDVFKNCFAYCGDAIPNPYGPRSDRLCRVWIATQLCESSVIILFANSIGPKVSSSNSIETKGAARFRRIREVGGKVSTSEDASRSVFYTEVEIPYMGFCQPAINERNQK